jgi:TonB-linked SusC/RagA family outer membrane protein
MQFNALCNPPSYAHRRRAECFTQTMSVVRSANERSHDAIGKTLLVMKLTAFLLMAATLQVSAGTRAQTVTYATKAFPLPKVFADLKKQTGYVFFYDSQDLQDAIPVTVNLRGVPLREALETILADEPVGFVIRGNTIVITLKEKTVTADESAALPPPPIDVHGRVTDSTGRPLAGASILVKGSRRVVSTDENGGFTLTGIGPDAVLVVSYAGYGTREVAVKGKRDLSLSLRSLPKQIEEVTVVTDGYETLPKERATGSYEVITARQLEHSTDPNLLKRLEGITTSFNFNNQLTPTNSALITPGSSPLTNLTIRGQNTIDKGTNAAAAFTGNVAGVPLVVIDGIAGPYSIDQVNPNDVESITILKDAAAASIWGSRAANGVIVVTTKKGGYGKQAQVSFSSSLSVTGKPNLFYHKEMSTSDFIDAETYAFNQANITTPDPIVQASSAALTPVQEILNAQKLGRITAAAANAELDSLRGNDVRNDLEKYFYRKAVTQAYQLGVAGGSDKTTYRLSVAYDKTLNNTLNNGGDRANISYVTSTKPVKNLELTANVAYGLTDEYAQAGESGFSGQAQGLYPYTQLADANGNPLAITKDYRPSFISLLDSTYGSKIFDLTYKPLEDINDGYFKLKTQDVNFNLDAKYRLNPIFSGSINYDYSRQSSTKTDYDSPDSYYMRNLIDKYTNPSTFAKNIPLGGFYQPTAISSYNETIRGQINADKTWAAKHALHALAGFEYNNTYYYSREDTYYGYDPNSLTVSNNLNYASSVQLLWADGYTGIGFAPIPFVSGNIFTNRIRSYSLFGNAEYTYDNRYSFSASARKDENNEFGTGTNNQTTPFYSLGASWNIYKERFYNLSRWLTYLRFRATFGYNGNVNPAIAPVAIFSRQNPSTSTNNLPYYSNAGTGVTNSELRPEKTGILNLGLDWSVKNSRLSGSLEYYDKHTSDLLTAAGIDPTTGFESLTYNVADLHGWGTELTLNSVNVKAGLFVWRSNFILSYNREVVTRLYNGPAQALTVYNVILGAPAYNVGADLSRLYAYRWAGLNPQTGDPMGYVNGKAVTLSPDAAGSQNSTDVGNQPLSAAHYFGSSVPVYFGSFNQTFSYGRLTLSAIIIYKLDYYFRRPTADVVGYGALYGNGGSPTVQGIEYERRWQKPGDERITNVPSATTANATYRDTYYYYSDINVLPADHIRLKEVNLGYTFKNRKFIKNPTVSIHVNNLGILWRANKLGLDPDIYDLPQPRTYSIAFNCNF